MITFKQYLSESRMASLFHGASTINIRAILDKNVLEARTVQNSSSEFNQRDRIKHKSNLGTGVKGVSLSRSMLVAKRFGNCILELDQQKLSQNYKVKPYNYWFSDAAKKASAFQDRTRAPDDYNRHNEAEEFVVGDIKNINKYVKTIWVPRSVLRWWDEYGDKVKGYDL